LRPWVGWRTGGPRQGQGTEQVQRGGRAEPTPQAEFTVDGQTTAPTSINLVLFEFLARKCLKMSLRSTSPMDWISRILISHTTLHLHASPSLRSPSSEDVPSGFLPTSYLFTQPPNISINNKEGCQPTSIPHPKFNLLNTLHRSALVGKHCGSARHPSNLY